VVDAAPASVLAVRDIAGLRVRIAPEGHIRLEGRDRWGGDVSTTYESVTWLERSLPALERSLTPAQMEGLRALVSALRARDAG
jgi:hypothetical protein